MKRSIAFLGHDRVCTSGKRGRTGLTYDQCLAYGPPGGPIGQSSSISCAESVLPVVRRRHDLVGVVGGDPLDQLALLGVAADDGGIAAQVGECPLAPYPAGAVCSPLTLLRRRGRGTGSSDSRGSAGSRG